MQASRPENNAIVKKREFIISRRGKPKLIFETPRTNFNPSFPYFSLRMEIARHVSRASFCWELTVRVKVSISIFLRGIPYFLPSSIIFSATLTRPKASGAMPFSSIQRQTIHPPYFFTRGKTLSITSCLPFTEFIKAFPL